MSAEPECPIYKTTYELFIKSLTELSMSYQSQDSNRLTLLYFIVSGLDLLGSLDEVKNKEEIIDWIYSLQIVSSQNIKQENLNQRVGFCGSPFMKVCVENSTEHVDSIYNRSHIVMTYSALSVLAILGDSDFKRVDRDAINLQLKALQNSDGSYSCIWGGESDIRYVYCAICVATFLNDWSHIDVPKAKNWILSCMTYDGVFGQSSQMESHGGSLFCAIASLSLMEELGCLGFKNRSLQTSQGYHKQSEDCLLTSCASGILDWLINRQCGGFQGRVNKSTDSCYIWWLGSTLQMLGYFDLLDFGSLYSYTVACQHDSGGFSRNPNFYPDIMHSYFSICGLSMLNAPKISKPHCALGISLRAAKSFSHLKISN